MFITHCILTSRRDVGDEEPGDDQTGGMNGRFLYVVGVVADSAGSGLIAASAPNGNADKDHFASAVIADPSK
jgi:hypothetical protein